MLKNQYKWVLLVTVLLSLEVKAQSDFSDTFSGAYLGVEIGPVSYNTQITFDGVDDPAGRGGFGYSAFFGYSKLFNKLLVGGECHITGEKEPDPYTFDPAVTGFSDLELKRSASLGFDLRGGYLHKRLLLYGSLGYARHKQTVLIDGVPLDQFSGGSDPERFGRILLGLGLEIAVTQRLSIRGSFKHMRGHDLDRTDFGSVATSAGLQRLDVEPNLLQIFTGVIFHI